MSDEFVAPSIENPSAGSATSNFENAKNTAVSSEVSYSFLIAFLCFSIANS